MRTFTRRCTALLLVVLTAALPDIGISQTSPLESRASTTTPAVQPRGGPEENSEFDLILEPVLRETADLEGMKRLDAVLSYIDKLPRPFAERRAIKKYYADKERSERHNRINEVNLQLIVQIENKRKAAGLDDRDIKNLQNILSEDTTSAATRQLLLHKFGDIPAVLQHQTR